MAKRKKDQTIKVDFSKAGQGGRPRLPEGEYIVKITKVEYKKASTDNPMLVWTFEITEGKYAGKKIMTNTMLMEKSLWVLRNLIEATGTKVPEKVVNLPIQKFVGKELGITLIDGEPYGDRNRISSEVADFLAADVVRSGGVDDDEEDYDEDEDEEDEDEVDEDEEEDEDDDEEEDLDEMDLEDL